MSTKVIFSPLSNMLFTDSKERVEDLIMPDYRLVLIGIISFGEKWEEINKS